MSLRLTWTLALAAAVFTAAGCASDRDSAHAAATAPVARNWRNVVTDADALRLRQWREAWTKALAAARTAGAGASIADEGPLLDPDVALPFQEPPPGEYRCRTIKLGAKGEGSLNYVPYPWFDCQISREGDALRFVKVNGSQRPVGVLLPQTSKRMVFLGTLQLGDETNALDYGRDNERDMAALLELIGERRWRLVFPYPHFESLIDVMELVPAGQAPR